MTREVSVGVIGCGYWGPNLIRNFARAEGSRVVALCDAQLERATHAAAWSGASLVTADASELIHDPRVDLVVVATPSGTHYPLAKAALEAGKHVLIMKPMTTRVDHAEELVDLARRKGLVVAVDHTFVYTGAVRKMRELAAGGELGDIYYMDSVRINLGLFQSDVNVIWDLAPHDVSIIDFVLGGPLPTEVSAIGAAHAGSRHENIAYLTLRYGPNLLAHVHVNWLAPAKIRRTIIGGSRQMVVYDDVQPSEKLLIYDRGVTIAPWDDPEAIYSQMVSYRSGDMYAPRLDDREALSVEAEEVVQAILRGGPIVADGESGLRTVRILDAAERSVRDGGRPVQIVGAEPALHLSSVPVGPGLTASRDSTETPELPLSHTA
jgi:predicted dehydrogenase